MTEKVSTGGEMTFAYGKDYSPKLSKEQEKEIDNAYGKYYERKRREKQRKNLAILIGVILIILILIGIYFFILRR